MVLEPSCYADSRGPGAKGVGRSGILDARAKVQLLVFAAPVITLSSPCPIWLRQRDDGSVRRRRTL